jgi:hypothetical protein
MRKRMMLGAAGAALLAGAALAGMSLAEPDGIGEPRAVADVVVAAPVTGVAARATDSPRGTRRRPRPTIDFFYARNDLVPPDGGGLVQPIRCPRRAGNPIGGGARTAQGIVVSYLSRVNPVTGATPDRTYFVGVDDNSDDPGQDGAGALVEVQCAKGMRVKD